MDITTFKNTAPAGISFLISGSENKVRAVNIAVNDCNLNNIAAVLGRLTNFTITVDTTDTIFYVTSPELISTTHYFYDIDSSSYSPADYPTFNTSSTISEVCYSTATSPEVDLGFDYSDYNVLIGQADNLRESSYIFEVDRNEDNINPTNLSAIISESAAKAEVQDSSYYSQAFTRPRYSGVKLDSGSLFYDDPSLTFVPFKASVHGSNVKYNQIVNITDTERVITTLYFNPDTPNSKQSIPSLGKPIYQEDGNKFIRLENKKFFIEESGLLGQIGTGSANIAPTFDKIINPPFQSTSSYENQPTGSQPSGSIIFNFDISNYSQTQNGYIQYLDGNNIVQQFAIPPDSDTSICAISIIQSSNVVITQNGLC